MKSVSLLCVAFYAFPRLETHSVKVEKIGGGMRNVFSAFVIKKMVDCVINDP